MSQEELYHMFQSYALQIHDKVRNSLSLFVLWMDLRKKNMDLLETIWKRKRANSVKADVGRGMRQELEG